MLEVVLAPPANADADGILDALLAWTAELGVELYPAQEDAIVELLSDRNVILTTPTGSGKSLVAVAQHLAAQARGERSFYTAPTKALVSEKFFELRQLFGPDQVGMVTGDAAINPNAPVVCCTAEILANMALRHGDATPVDRVAMDEFHFYADRDRGWAWQVPLLELTSTRFLLMSATLGDPSFFEAELTRRTGRATTVVHQSERPVPLSFQYRETPLHESINELLELDRAPVYLVHFTQKAATEAAQSLTSIDVLTRSEKAAIGELIGRFRFDSPFGKDLRRYVSHGIGVHHAGLLPKYRLLVERLAQAGLLKLICGTDTLGVGVNVPIRTVLFTQLCKFDGANTVVLSVREFQQIAGRAGRKGFDDRGYVWAQAPAHVIDNLRAAQKAADAGKKRPPLKRKPPERGYAHWDAATFERLVGRDPAPLQSSFAVSHAMLLDVLDRPGDGCAALRRLLVDNHEPRRRQRHHIRRAVSMYRSLVAADIIEQLDEPDDVGRRVRVTVELQDDFSLNQPLSPFVLDVIDRLDGEEPTYALDVLTVVEATLENPMVVLLAQRERDRTALLADLKAQGVEYEERRDRLVDLSWPQPSAAALHAAYLAFAIRHPWVGDEPLRPKAVVREMYEQAWAFDDFVVALGLRRSEGVLLRYLSDAFRALQRTVPEPAKTDELDELIAWLGAVVRSVDSSLIDEWDRLVAGFTTEAAIVDEAEVMEDASAPPDVTRDERAFRALVRNGVFRWVQLLAARNHVELAGAAGWEVADLDTAVAPYWDEHEWIAIDAAARGPDHFRLERTGEDRWPVTQWLVDPADTGEWRIEASVDVARSRTENRAVLVLDRIGRT